LVIALSCSGPLWAGDVTGKIRGTITDGKGTPLEGVTVTITDTTTESRVYTVVTKKGGKFYYLGLEPAVHSVEGAMEGYRPSTKQVRTRLGLWVEANMTLFKEGESGFANTGAKTDEERAIEEFNGALLLIEEGKPQEALAALDRAIELDDMIYEPLQTKGQVYFEMGEFDKAKQQFDKAMEMGSTDPSNYFFLSEIYKSKGDATKADEYSQLYLNEADNVNVDVLFNMAAKALNDSDDATAKDYLLQIVEAEPDYADAHRELGYVLVREGDFPGAKEHFQKYLDLSPEAADAGEISSMMEIL
jgi:Tfp pilus assembly protein PilF